MTSQEHELMIAVLATQVEALHSLDDALKSRGVLDADDLHAFSQIRSPEAQKQSMERARQMYAVMARTVGIDLE